MNSTATKRLMLLEAKFKMYLLLNEEKEFLAIKINPHRDFYNVRKVNTECTAIADWLQGRIHLMWGSFAAASDKWMLVVVLTRCLQVDTHIHHSAAMHQKHLLRFIKKKLKVDADRIVIFRDGKELTLAEVPHPPDMTNHGAARASRMLDQAAAYMWYSDEAAPHRCSNPSK